MTQNNVVSFDTAQRLKEAGFKIQTQFYFINNGKTLIYENSDGILIHIEGEYDPFYTLEDKIPAPTFQELWDALPKYIVINQKEYSLTLTPNYDRQWIGYNANLHVFILYDDSIAEATAQLLLMLKQQQLI